MQNDTELIVKIVAILVLAVASLFVTVKIYQNLPAEITCRVENPFNEFQSDLCVSAKYINEYL